MRQLKANCEKCNRAIRFVESMAGQPTICPHCRQEITLPVDFRQVELLSEPTAGPSSAADPSHARRSGHQAAAAGPSRGETVYAIDDQPGRPSAERSTPPSNPAPLHATTTQTRQPHAVTARPTTNRYQGPYACPYCSSYMQPYVRKQVSTAGWVTLIVLLIFFFPLFWIGFLITEPVRHCSCCGRSLGAE